MPQDPGGSSRRRMFLQMDQHGQMRVSPEWANGGWGEQSSNLGRQRLESCLRDPTQDLGACAPGCALAARLAACGPGAGPSEGRGRGRCSCAGRARGRRARQALGGQCSEARAAGGRARSRAAAALRRCDSGRGPAGAWALRGAGVGECEPWRRRGGRCGDPRNFWRRGLGTTGGSASWAFLTSAPPGLVCGGGLGFWWGGASVRRERSRRGGAGEEGLGRRGLCTRPGAAPSPLAGLGGDHR